MPELPEVETIRRDLREKILHKDIIRVDILRKKTVRSNHQEFKDFLVANKFKSVDRVGKLLMFDFGNGNHLFVHLKMTGQLIYVAGDSITAGGHSDGPDLIAVPNAHTRASIHFADSSVLYFNDMRVFGYLQLADVDRKEKTVKKYGIEPLTNNFKLGSFEKLMKRRKTSIKAVLLNQAMIAGIGNIYADEACFEAGVRPSKQAGELTSQQVGKLHVAIQKVIKKAVEERGTTFNNYVDSDGKKGNYVNFLKVYGRGGEPCIRCKSILKKVKVAGRGTVFCLECQK